MNALRSIVTSFLVILFLLTALATALVWGALRTATPEALSQAVGAARLGERLPVLFTGQLSSMFAELPVKLKDDVPARIIAEALPSAEVERALDGFARGTAAYIRGESAQAAALDPAPFIDRAKKALAAQIPGYVGRAAANEFQAIVAELGWDKGLAIPAEGLGRAKEWFALGNLAVAAGAAISLLLLVIIFLAAPHGLRGRLKHVGIALLTLGLELVAIALVMSRVVAAAAPSVPDLPPEALAAIKDFLVSIFSSLGSQLLVPGGIIFVLGIAVLVLRALLSRKPKEEPPAPLRTLPSGI